MTLNQNKTIHAQLHQLGIMHHKPTIVLGISNGRTEKSSELDVTEANALIAYLKAESQKLKAESEKGQHMRNTIVAMAHELGWISTKTIVTQQGMKTVKDYSNLENWLLKYGYLKKKLYNYNYEELPKLVTQFKEVYKFNLTKKNKPL